VSATPSGRRVFRRTRALLIFAMVGANVIGAAVVSALAIFVVPDIPPIAGSTGLTVAAIGIYVGLAVPIGIRRGIRRFGDMKTWLREDAVPTERQQMAVLRGPFRLTRVMGALWLAGALLFGTVDFISSPAGGVKTLIVVVSGGITTCSIAYLLAERILRPAAARALEAGDARKVGLGVAMRTLLTWALATGVPVAGLVMLGIASLAGENSKNGLALAVISLGGVVLVFGLLATFFVARATADPIKSVRKALAQVEAGDLDVHVPVYDGTEVGLLQAGFNRMAEGLRERERVRDLFGRHVGEDVAREALEGGVELGGEVREVAALFVDLVGSTSLAARSEPGAVVEMLNRFFAVVVAVVEKHGGFVNKFEGDAALAVFGAPAPLDDRAGSALAAAREMAARLRDELPEMEAGIGVSGGEAVAGNVGAAHRFEYTVIGDPVNEAARLTELAKELDGHVAASETLVQAAGERERERWRLADEVTLRGRSGPTRVYVPG
jgi:adenylate cyclase